MDMPVRRRQRPVPIPENEPNARSARRDLATAIRVRRLVIEYIPVGVPKPALRLLRLHNEKQIHNLMGRISSEGFLDPIFIDEADVLIDGHARVEAARRLGLVEIPVL